MAIKTLIVLLLLVFLNGCASIEIQAGPKFDKSLYPEAISAHRINDSSDRIVLNDGTEVTFKRAVGLCGARGGVGIILIIPFPLFMPNTCEEGFLIHGYTYGAVINLKLKYNNKIYEPINIRRYTKNFEIEFKVNMKELLGSEYKAIIVEKEGFIQELPFEWGVMIIDMSIN